MMDYTSIGLVQRMVDHIAESRPFKVCILTVRKVNSTRGTGWWAENAFTYNYIGFLTIWGSVLDDVSDV